MRKMRGAAPASRRRAYAISTIAIEWSAIPASRSACEYRQDVVRAISEGVAKA
jgi:hypothetical protein